MGNVQRKMAQKLGLSDLQLEKINPFGRILYIKWMTWIILDNHVYSVKVDLLRNFKKNDWLSKYLALHTGKYIIFTLRELLKIQDIFYELLRGFNNA